ncbi:MAG: methionyl-tRNA formyltransferase [Pseudomonadota bacterium]
MLRVVFMGTPDFSVPTLSEIMAAGHDIVAVYSQPPRPAGRGMSEVPSPVHQFAASSGLDVYTPRSLRDGDAQAVFASHEADVAVVVAYGLILPKPILEAPVHGCLNVHASALPRWRGAAPIQRAIMAGDEETAVMIMQMDEGLDTGAICLAEQVPIGPDMTAGELHDVLSERGASLTVRALSALARGSLVATPQVEDGVTYAAKIEKSEARIDFRRTADDVHNHIRGLSPFPGAWFLLPGDGAAERVKVLSSQLVPVAGGAPGTVLDDQLTVACGTGGIRCEVLQRAGKRAMTRDEFLRGRPIAAGTVLPSVESSDSSS